MTPVQAKRDSASIRPIPPESDVVRNGAEPPVAPYQLALSPFKGWSWGGSWNRLFSPYSDLFRKDVPDSGRVGEPVKPAKSLIRDLGLDQPVLEAYNRFHSVPGKTLDFTEIDIQVGKDADIYYIEVGPSKETRRKNPEMDFKVVKFVIRMDSGTLNLGYSLKSLSEGQLRDIESHLIHDAGDIIE